MEFTCDSFTRGGLAADGLPHLEAPSKFKEHLTCKGVF